MPGVSAYEIVKATWGPQNLVGGAFATATATCPGTKRAIGGGATLRNSQVLDVQINAPNDAGTAWVVSLKNPNGATIGSVEATAHAICANVQ